jgi:hypothetical protein
MSSNDEIANRDGGDNSKMHVAKKSASSMKNLIAGLDLPSKKSLSSLNLAEKDETKTSQPKPSVTAGSTASTTSKLKRSVTATTASLSLTAFYNNQASNSKPEEKELATVQQQQQPNKEDDASQSTKTAKKTANDFVHMLANYEEFSSYFNNKFNEFSSKFFFSQIRSLIDHSRHLI